VAKKKTSKAGTAGKTTTRSRGTNKRFPKAEKPRTKSEIYRLISERTDLSRQQVSSVFDTMRDMMEQDLKKSCPQSLNVPGLMKVVVRRKPAQKAIKNWKNPFTGELQTKPAKPAANVVKIRPLKGLKDMV